MHRIDNHHYSPRLRAKDGEAAGLHELDEWSKNHIVPQLVLLPLSAPENRAMAVDEAIKSQIGRILSAWGSRPCILDLGFLEFDKDKGSDAARVLEFLNKAHQFGCRGIPVVPIDVNQYRLGAFSAYINRSRSGAAIRITLSDLNNEDLRETILALLKELRIGASECILLFDLSDADMDEVDEFAKFFVDRLFELRAIASWNRIITNATNYPTVNPAPKNGQIMIHRNEWFVWQKALALDPTIASFAVFGDFGPDNAVMDFSPSNARAITHLRYATRDGKCLVSRGGKPVPGDSGTIQSAAMRIKKSGVFEGPDFSWGDNFIDVCGTRPGGQGNPTNWRSANVNHHLTLVAASSAKILGLAVERPAKVESLQASLFAATAPAAE